MSPVPDGLPVLSSGAHGSPAAGACLMEFASILAGEQFSDRPVCVDPLLSDMARVVNDASNDANRQQLVHLLPRFIGTNDHQLTYQQADELGERLVSYSNVAICYCDDCGANSSLRNRARTAGWSGRGTEFLTELLDHFEAITGRIPNPDGALDLAQLEGRRRELVQVQS